MEVNLMDYEGKKWKELSESEQEKLLKTANAIDGRTGNDMVQDGECIIDLEYMGHIVCDRYHIYAFPFKH